MNYECFIKPGWSAQDIEAESADEARKIFRDRIRDNLATQHIIANNLDTDDGTDDGEPI